MQPESTDATVKQHDRKLSLDELRKLFERTGVEQTVATAEAAELLGVEPQTLRRWACEGSGPIRPRKLNGRLRWSVADIRKVLGGETATA